MCEPGTSHRRRGGNVLPGHCEKDADCTGNGLSRYDARDLREIRGIRMAIFSKERTPSRPFDCWDLACWKYRAAAGKRCEVRDVGKSPSPGGDGRPPCHRAPGRRANRSNAIGGSNLKISGRCVFDSVLDFSLRVAASAVRFRT